MKVIVNSEEKDTQAKTVSELAQELGLPDKGVALAINNKMVQRTNWEATKLVENDKVIIIKAACGG